VNAKDGYVKDTLEYRLNVSTRKFRFIGIVLAIVIV
jgi:hypothetical protein